MILLQVSYRGARDLDARIERAVGRANVSTGYSFTDRTRDLDFEFRQRAAAFAAARRARAIRGVRARVQIYAL